MIAKLGKIFQDLSSSTVVAIVKLRLAILTAKGLDLSPFLFHATVVPFIQAKLSKPVTSNDKNMTQLFAALVLTQDILDAVATFWAVHLGGAVRIHRPNPTDHRALLQHSNAEAGGSAAVRREQT